MCALLETSTRVPRAESHCCSPSAACQQKRCQRAPLSARHGQAAAGTSPEWDLTTGPTARRRHSSHQHCARSRVVNCEAEAPAAPAANTHKKHLSDRSGPVVLVDNYDSFTYNLSQYLGNLGCHHIVVKNDEVTVDDIRHMNPKGILVSPGPGRPEDSGISLEIIRELGPELPLLGVCMGHQCIGQVFGGTVIRAPCGVMHGKASPVHHSGDGVLQNLEEPFQAARYHSLVIDQESFPDQALEITARTADGTIMAVRHRDFPLLQGVQFHPESIITSNGLTIIQNFIDML